MIFKTINFNRFWKLQCKQCTYTKAAERAYLLSLFPSGEVPPRAGQFRWALQSWMSKPSVCLTAQLLHHLRVQSVADVSWHRNQWCVGQTCHAFSLSLCAHVHLMLVRERQGVFRGLDTSMTKQTCRLRELSSRSDELSYRAAMTRFHY